MAEINLNVKRNGKYQSMNIKGDTYEEAKVLAEAVYKILCKASEQDKKVIEKLIKADEPITYKIVTKEKAAEYKDIIDMDESLIRIDKDGMYHILTLSNINDEEQEETEEAENDTEAKALKRLRGEKSNAESDNVGGFHHGRPSPVEIQKMMMEERMRNNSFQSDSDDDVDIDEKISKKVDEKIRAYIRSIRSQLDDLNKEIRILNYKMEEIKNDGRQSGGNAD